MDWIPTSHAMPNESDTYLVHWNDGAFNLFYFDVENPLKGWYEKDITGALITHFAEITKP